MPITSEDTMGSETVLNKFGASFSASWITEFISSIVRLSVFITVVKSSKEQYCTGTFKVDDIILPLKSGNTFSVHSADLLSLGIILFAADRLLLKLDPARSWDG